MRRKISIIFILAIFAMALNAGHIKINLFNDFSVKSAVFSVVSGPYIVTTDAGHADTLTNGETMLMRLKHNQIELRMIGGKILMAHNVDIYSSNPEAIFQLHALEPLLDARLYHGNIKSKVDFNRLLFINDVNFDLYLAGVVETESGSYAKPEFYKAQATLCRTYALKNHDRHLEEGFHLCDGTHCQAYKSKNRYNDAIYHAVLQTQQLVVVDADTNLITAAFHANSGGVTFNSEDVWLLNLPYLRSVNDVYSLRGRQLNWQQKIDRQKWVAYLIENGFKFNSNQYNLTFTQPVRTMNYSLGTSGQISLAKIRNDWDLKSTFFDVQDNGSQILLKGRGYGHGVGLSQEGAMIMAIDGFTFEEIIHFYFKDVLIISNKQAGYSWPW